MTATMEMKATRDAYGTALIELAEREPRLLVMDSDLSRSTRTDWFMKRFPERFLNLGIAEQNMVGVAAGLAASGFLPFVTTYAIFINRCFDQIRQAVCYAGANVKIVATHAGLAASYDGGSHQGLEDIALMRVLPGMTVLSPADYNEARQAIFAAALHPGPVYIRLQKEPVPVVTDPDTPFVIGPARVLAEGGDVALIATGSMVARALEAAGVLAAQGIGAAVVAVATLKPLDGATIRKVVERCGCAVTVEEHNSIGGLHEAVTGAIGGAVAAPVVPVAMHDRFGETGGWHELLEAFDLTGASIAATAMDAIELRRHLPTIAHATAPAFPARRAP
jgi:transketolase